MKRLFAILFALFCTMPLFCQDREVDSLLRVLDASVQGRERYTLERQSQINALQCQLKATRPMRNYWKSTRSCSANTAPTAWTLPCGQQIVAWK